MKVLFLLMHSFCNIACEYCFYTTHHESRTKERLLREQMEDVAQKISALGFTSVILTGGDPLHSIYKHDAYLCISLLKKLGMRVIINTSAAYLTDEDLDTIVALDVDRIDVSIDSHDEAIHDAQRGRHADALHAITGLFARGYHKVATTTVVTARNASTLADTVVWLRALGVNDIRMQRAFLPGELPKKNDPIMESMRAASQLVERTHTLQYVNLTSHAQRYRGALPGASCRMGKEYFVCGAGGEITPCFHRPDVVIGNLFTDGHEVLVPRFAAHELAVDDMPSCFGRHCVSLFDNPMFWQPTS